MDIEPADLLDVASSRVIGNVGDIKNADAGAVVGERGDAVLDVEVVVDRLHFVFVEAGDLGLCEAADVPLWRNVVSVFLLRRWWCKLWNLRSETRRAQMDSSRRSFKHKILVRDSTYNECNRVAVSTGSLAINFVELVVL